MGKGPWRTESPYPPRKKPQKKIVYGKATKPKQATESLWIERPGESRSQWYTRLTQPDADLTMTSNETKDLTRVGDHC